MRRTLCRDGRRSERNPKAKGKGGEQKPKSGAVHGTGSVQVGHGSATSMAAVGQPKRGEFVSIRASPMIVTVRPAIRGRGSEKRRTAGPRKMSGQMPRKADREPLFFARALKEEEHDERLAVDLSIFEQRKHGES